MAPAPTPEMRSDGSEQDPLPTKSADMFGGLQLNSEGLPVRQGLYDPQYERDACGVGFVVSIDGKASRKVRSYTFVCEHDM